MLKIFVRTHSFKRNVKVVADINPPDCYGVRGISIIHENLNPDEEFHESWGFDEKTGRIILEGLTELFAKIDALRQYESRRVRGD